MHLPPTNRRVRVRLGDLTSFKKDFVKIAYGVEFQRREQYLVLDSFVDERRSESVLELTLGSSGSKKSEGLSDVKIQVNSSTVVNVSIQDPTGDLEKPIHLENPSADKSSK